MRASALLFGLAIATLAADVLAGPELAGFPQGYQETFVLYNKVDRPDRKTIRFMYVDPEAHAAAEAGEPAPYGTVLIMEDHGAKLEGEEAVRDAEGRMVPTEEIANIFVMEKQPRAGVPHIRPRNATASGSTPGSCRTARARPTPSSTAASAAI